MHTSRLTLLALAMLTATAAHSSAQEQVYKLGAQATNLDDFGRSVADVEDADGDGVPDLLVGAPFDDAGGNASGSVYLYSGRTGNLIWTRAGQFAGDLFGWSVDGVGDVNGDGRGDVIVGAPSWDNNGLWDASSGAVYVLSGLNGQPISIFQINQLNAQLGYKVCGLGDIDGDNAGDYALAIPYRSWNGLNKNGYVAVYSGAGTNFLFSRSGSEDGAAFGYSMSAVRSTGSQATSRWICSEPQVDGAGIDRGQVRLMDGYGNTVSLFAGTTNHEWFGASVAGVGDVDGDGVNDYAIGSPYIDILFVGADAGMARVFSGANTNTVLMTIVGATAGANMGQSVAGAGDVNGDGRADVLAGAPNDDTATQDGGEVRLVSGQGGVLIKSWYGGFNDHMGMSVSTAGDLNGDGRSDVLFGAHDAPFGAGEAYVHLGGTVAPTIYCSAKVNSQGCVPQIATQGVPTKSIANNFYLTASNVINQKFGLLFWGAAANNTPFQGGVLCVQPPLKRTTPQGSAGSLGADDCSGAYSFHFSHAYMAAEGVQAGDRIYAQYWSRDPAATFQTGLTNAAAFDVIP